VAPDHDCAPFLVTAVRAQVDVAALRATVNETAELARKTREYAPHAENLALLREHFHFSVVEDLLNVIDRLRAQVAAVEAVLADDWSEMSNWTRAHLRAALDVPSGEGADS
jgi:hypothetical protein